jgi:acyl carrier protein
MENIQYLIRQEIMKLIPAISLTEIDNVPISGLGIDSLNLIDLILEIENKFNITIPMEKIDENLSLGEILKSID